MIEEIKSIQKMKITEKEEETLRIRQFKTLD